MRDALRWPEGEPEPCLEIEERHLSTLERRPADIVRPETEPVAIEADGPFQVIDTERDDGDSCVHDRIPGGRRYDGEAMTCVVPDGGWSGEEATAAQPGSTAVASISTRARASTSPATTTTAIAG